MKYPSPVEDRNRSPLDKCPPHTFPHSLILAQAQAGSPLSREGPQNSGNQQSFDYWWGYVSPQLDLNHVPTYSLKPIIDWDKEDATFLPIGIDSSCWKAEPYGEEMTTDCYVVTLPIYLSREGEDCRPPANYPVFIYIHPKTNLPFDQQFIYPTPTSTVEPVMTPTPLPVPTPTPEPESGDE
jgi:hypothetical protein